MLTHDSQMNIGDLIQVDTGFKTLPKRLGTVRLAPRHLFRSQDDHQRFNLEILRSACYRASRKSSTHSQGTFLIEGPDKSITTTWLTFCDFPQDETLHTTVLPVRAVNLIEIFAS